VRLRARIPVICRIRLYITTLTWIKRLSELIRPWCNRKFKSPTFPPSFSEILTCCGPNVGCRPDLCSLISQQMLKYTIEICLRLKCQKMEANDHFTVFSSADSQTVKSDARDLSSLERKCELIFCSVGLDANGLFLLE
jgi:hypothetical protein